MNLKTVKLASCRYLDTLPSQGNKYRPGLPRPRFRARSAGADPRSSASARNSAASISATTCASSACRATAPACRSASACPARPTGRSSARSTRDGVFLEELETNPAQYLPEIDDGKLGGEVVQHRPHPADERNPPQPCRAHPIKTRLSLTGPLIVARDIAHAKLQGARSIAARPCRNTSRTSRSTTPVRRRRRRATPRARSARPRRAASDSYVDRFMAAGGSFVTLAKGNRGAEVREACKQARRLLSRLDRRPGRAPRAGLHQARSRRLDYPELGMEAIWRIEVEDFPAFIVIDDKGNDFFAKLT